MMNIRHAVGFVVAGTLAFIVDASLLWGLTTIGLPLFMARGVSISVAMVVAWFINRTFTFCVASPPNLKEFLHYAALAWGVAALNYGIFTVLIAFGVTSQPLLATAIATFIAMAVSFLGMKNGVFTKNI